MRFQLELLKPQLVLDEAKIASTFVMYGSARIPEPEKAQAVLDARDDAQAERRSPSGWSPSPNITMSRASWRGSRRTSRSIDDGKRHFVVTSGGGPSIMEAANRGARDVGADTIGLNIVLPHEQAPNPYVTPSLSLQFHYFALRKMHFLLHARALAAFPGGFGTFDELFELLTLIQTGKIKPIPILLYGREFWDRVVNFEALVRGRRDLARATSACSTYCETARGRLGVRRGILCRWRPAAAADAGRVTVGERISATLIRVSARRPRPASR